MRAAVALVVLLPFCFAPGAGSAQSGGDAGPPGRDAAGPRGLPAAPGRVGTIRRDSSGRIVPVVPAESAPRDSTPEPRTPPVTAVPRRPAPEPRTPPAAIVPRPAAPAARTAPRTPPAAPRRATDPELRYLAALLDGADHAWRAKRLQLEVDRILREEHAARANGAPVDAHGFTAREVALADDLARRDREVRMHEAALYRIAAAHAQPPEFWYVTGPGKAHFAVSGVTRFDISPIEGDAEATAEKYTLLRRAALAPARPSDCDKDVAAELQRLILRYRRR